MIGRRFHAIAESTPGPKLAAVFARYRPGYLHWWARGGIERRPSWAECRRALERHMPELLPVWQRLVVALDASEVEARLLSLWCPPDFHHACSQAVWTRRPFAIVRNYDYPPAAFDAVLLRAELAGTPTLAMTDCIWGALDGLNAHGLAVSLAFGGRRAQGPGFGIALVLRYLLETCRDVAEALAVLRRVPVHLCYNLALLDRRGARATVAVSPDRGVELRREAFSTNRQGDNAWPEEAHLGDTVRREALIAASLHNPEETLEGLLGKFLTRPLHRPLGQDGWGTLYTACWLPDSGAVRLLWPGRQWRQSLAGFAEEMREIGYA